MRADYLWTDIADEDLAEGFWDDPRNTMEPDGPGRRLRNGDPMAETWVVYTPYLRDQPGARAVCTQAEWDAMEKSQPGRQPLVKAGIASEGEAEQLARPPVPEKPRNVRPPTVPPAEAP